MQENTKVGGISSMVSQAISDIAIDLNVSCNEVVSGGEGGESQDYSIELDITNDITVSISCIGSRLILMSNIGYVKDEVESLRRIYSNNYFAGKIMLGSGSIVDNSFVLIFSEDFTSCDDEYNVFLSKVKLYLSNFVASIAYWSASLGDIIDGKVESVER